MRTDTGIAWAGLALAVLACSLHLLRPGARAGGEGGRANPALAPAPTEPSRIDPERLATLERRLEELALRIGELEAGAEPRRSSAPLERASPSAPSSAEPLDAEPRTPLWYLQQYALSFQRDGAGSEFYRRNVEAFASSLLGEIAALAVDERAHLPLRLRLIEILGDARFAGRSAVVDVLLRLLASSSQAEVLRAAVAALGVVGDQRAGAALERIVPHVLAPEAQREAVRTLLRLVGESANATLARLLASASDPDLRVFLLSLVRKSDPAGALDLLRAAASDAEEAVRLRAARAIGGFQGEDFRAFVAHWIAAEPSEAVRAALGETQRRMSELPNWSAMQATGPPDVPDPAQDDPRAWASKAPNSGAEWLELGYDPPRRASGVRIFEVNAPGALTRLLAFDPAGVAHELWAGTDPTIVPGVFEISFPTTSFRVARLRILLDTRLRPDWNEIDAVELLGPDGRAFAKTAAASSSFSD